MLEKTTKASTVQLLRHLITGGLSHVTEIICQLFTARIRRMTGGYIFSLSTLAGGGGYPISGLGRGVPYPRSRGVPHPRSR